MSDSYVFREIAARETNIFQDYLEELHGMKMKFEQTIEDMRRSINRIEEIEQQLGVSREEIRQKVKKSVSKDDFNLKQVVDFKLVENDDDVPEGSETVLMDFGNGLGDIIIMKREDLKELCSGILLQPINSTIEVSNFTNTERSGVFNDGEWYLRKNDNLMLS